MLDERFRRKFEPHGDGYMFREWDRDVLFTRAEVDGFVAARRRVWANPFLWGGWLLVGAAIPAMLWLSGADYSSELALLLALVSAVILAVVLKHAERQPDDAAQSCASCERRGGRDVKRLWLVLPMMGLAACGSGAAPPRDEAYRWTQLNEAAPYPGSYNFPVHVAADGRFLALHFGGTWSSRDGKAWTREPLPASPTNSGNLPILQHDGASWGLGVITGNYLSFRIDPLITRTRDYRAWETVGRSPTLPHVIFPAAASFKGAMWLLGGYDGKRGTNAVWRSADGLAWQRVTGHAPWSARSGAKAAVFRGRLFLIGGGVLDGANAGDVWSTADGAAWVRETERIAQAGPVGFTPQVFDGKLWLVGANRSGGFTSEMLVSEDGRSWRAVHAPWSPRGGVATWTDGRRMYLTGGKYSHEVNEMPVFDYSHDVWAMERGR